MTDLPAFSGTLDGTEIIEIVAAPTGQTNEASGVNYQLTTAQLAALIVTGSASVVIANGQYSSPGAPYTPTAAISRIYINKTIASPTYITFAVADTYTVEPLIKDVAGTVDVGSEVHVAFTGGEQADGNATVLIQTPYGGYFFRPISSLDKWTLGSP